MFKEIIKQILAEEFYQTAKAQEAKTQPEPIRQKQILVLTLEVVILGDIERHGNELKVFNGGYVREHGRDKGIVDLAMYGPSDETIICWFGGNEVEINDIAVHHKINCGWE